MEKSQAVRLLDVIFVGPWMIRAAIKENDSVLLALGLLTIIYNGMNYLETQNPGQ